ICRYGGDEFAIATTRRIEGATALAQRLRETVNLPVEIEGTQERVTASVGFAGGRRVEPRTAAHIAATVDDLLTLASRGSTLAKESGQGIVHHTRREEERDLRQPGRRYRRGEIRLRLDHAVVAAEPHQSAATGAADAHLAVCRAVLDALNRRLARILEGMLQRDPEAQHGSSEAGAPSLQSIEN